MSDVRDRPDRTLPLPLLHRGKVRDVYEVDTGPLLMVASDRVSAFDVVMRSPIPRKGEVLTLVTAWWLARLADHVDHHLLAVDPDVIVGGYPGWTTSRDAWARRAMLVRRTRARPGGVRGPGLHVRLGVEGVPGDAGRWPGSRCRRGWGRATRLDPPIFSPATKAEGGHDENITFATVRGAAGQPSWPGGCGDLSPGDLRRRAADVAASTASSWPTPSSSSAATRTAGSCSSTRC